MSEQYRFSIAGPGVEIHYWVPTAELQDILDMTALVVRKFQRDFSRKPMHTVPRHAMQWADDGGRTD